MYRDVDKLVVWENMPRQWGVPSTLVCPVKLTLGDCFNALIKPAKEIRRWPSGRHWSLLCRKNQWVFNEHA